MIVGVMSDTHDNVSYTLKAIDKLVEAGVEEVIHLGDIISPFIPRFIKKRLDEENVDLRIMAVLGNNDGDVYLLSRLFNEYGWRLLINPSIIEIDGRRFYVMHGFNGIEFTEMIAEKLLEKLDVDGVLYGHTHRLKHKYLDGKLLLNPGEVCGYLTNRSTIALLDTSDLSIRIIEL